MKHAIKHLRFPKAPVEAVTEFRQVTGEVIWADTMMDTTNIAFDIGDHPVRARSHGGVMLPGMLPVQTALLLWLILGERWTQDRAASLALVVAGVALLARDTFGAHPGAWRGDLLLFGGSFSWAIYTLLVRRWRIPALTATLDIALYAAPVYLPVWLLLLPSRVHAAPIGEVFFQLVYQGALAVVLAGFLFTRALMALGPMALTAITAVVPAVVALAAWPFLGEPLGAQGLVGVGLVTAAMLLGVVQARGAAETTMGRR